MEDTIPTLSTGDKSTLGNYKKLTKAFFGEDSKAVAFLDEKIKESPNGENEAVLTDERQMVYLLGEIHMGRTLDA